MVEYFDPESDYKPRRRTNPAARAQKLAERRAWAASLSGVEAEQKAKDAALRILDRCDQSVAQCRTKLLDKGYPEEAVESVINRLIEVDILNDLRYGQILARTRHQERGLVGQALRAELQRKQLPQSIIQQILTEMEQNSLSQTAQQLVEKKLRSLNKLPKEVKIRRLLGMLARKGYPGSIATEAITKALEFEDVESPD